MNSAFKKVTEELLSKTTTRYYGGGNELKVGDKVIFGFTNSSEDTMTLSMFVLSGELLYQLYKK